MKMKINVDRIICILAVGYIILPICLFSYWMDKILYSSHWLCFVGVFWDSLYQ